MGVPNFINRMLLVTLDRIFWILSYIFPYWKCSFLL